ncbi:IS3 family transposase [Alicyclobacillus herbarius]|uniref:IS3 family transposase n=1 Tax=Alicyclobacillus herbarius TaxID=122960 RepID=UPI003CCBA175
MRVHSRPPCARLFAHSHEKSIHLDSTFVPEIPCRYWALRSFSGPNVNSRRLYGSPKITQVLQKERVRVSHKTVARIMQERGLKSRTVITKRPPTRSITTRYMRIC